MTGSPTAKEDRPLANAGATSAQTYARIAGVLFLISLVAGGFGELYVPSKLIVSGDATATAHNITNSLALFRMGFAGYLVEAACDVSLALLLYVLLRPVSRNLALLAAFFRLLATATFAIAEFFYIAPSLILGDAAYLKTFSPDQLNTLALLSLKLYGYGGDAFLMFYGVGSILFGYLIFRSGYFPKTLGVLLVLGGLGFVATNFTLFLAPAYESSFFQLPTILAVLALTIWLLVKGLDISKWNAKAATSDIAI